jgi:hypothetical protein
MDYYIGAADCFLGNTAKLNQTEDYYKGYNDQYQSKQIKSKEECNEC